MPEKIKAYAHRNCMRHINNALKYGYEEITLDFTKTTHAYPNGMIPIISTVDYFKKENIKFKIKLPYKDYTRDLFFKLNWAHLLMPDKVQAQETNFHKHLAAKRFTNFQAQQKVVNEFMNVVISNVKLKKDIISAIEWSINEITDNVLNHSNAIDGGLVQVSTYPQEERISFAVADSGIGIKESLKEAYPQIPSDLFAIGEAVKSGITRNPKYGQGNGLAGALRIADLSGGSFSIISGKGHINYYSGETHRKEPFKQIYYNGTIVSADISNCNQDFSIERALEFGYSRNGEVLNIIDYNYLADDSHSFKYIMKDESTGFGNRIIGRQLRMKLLNIIDSNRQIPICIDWEGVPIISSSFADEFVGKLFLELGPLQFSERIRNIHMEKIIRGLIDKAISQRLTQAKDEIK